MLEEYQLTPMNELFNIEAIEQTLKQVDSLTPQQHAVLSFITQNPNEQYIELQNTFSMPDTLVIQLVLEYGTTSDDYDKMKQLQQQIRNQN